MGPRVEPWDGPTGSGGGARTHDKRINSPLLCQLSYPGREPKGYQRGRPVPKAVGASQIRGNCANAGCYLGGEGGQGSFVQSDGFAHESRLLGQPQRRVFVAHHL